MFSDIIARRLEILIERLSRREVKPQDNPTMVSFFDEVRLRELLVHLNGEPRGFDDILERLLVPGDIKPSTKFKDLVAKVVEKSRVKSPEAYEQKMNERVRMGLRAVIEELRGPLPGPVPEILSTDEIADHLRMTALMTGKLQARLTLEFEKYLFSPITPADLKGTLFRIQRRLVNRMVL